jgi:hypothetical protein
VFRKKNKKPHHSTLGAVFNPFGHGPSPWVVVPTFSGAEELFAGQPVLIGESRSGWSTGPIFAAFAFLPLVDFLSRRDPRAAR